MRKLALLVILLTASCNAWVRRCPYPPRTREPIVQLDAAVRVEMTCEGKLNVGSGVMVSDWQVLTALHVVDCQSDIARITVYTVKGKYKFAPEREWRSRDVARIQIFSADEMEPNIRPPAIRVTALDAWEPLYIQAAVPERLEVIGEATGWRYSNETFTYRAYTVEGNSGAGIYDWQGALVGIHLGDASDRKYGMLITEEMMP